MAIAHGRFAGQGPPARRRARRTESVGRDADAGRAQAARLRRARRCRQKPLRRRRRRWRRRERRSHRCRRCRHSPRPTWRPSSSRELEADARSDIFAFGAVLYEMVTGKPAFQEKTQALLDRCRSDGRSGAGLQGAADGAARAGSRHQALPEQGSPTATADGVGSDAPAPVDRRRRLAGWRAGSNCGAADRSGIAPSGRRWPLFSLGSGPGAIGCVESFGPRRIPNWSASRYRTWGRATVPLSMSPDGRWITNSRGGTNRGVDGLLLGSVRAQVLIEDNVITQPFWSPDSRSMAFFEDGKLKKATSPAALPRIICDTPTPIGGGTWNRDGVILFSERGVIQRVLAAGGQPTRDHGAGCGKEGI